MQENETQDMNTTSEVVENTVLETTEITDNITTDETTDAADIKETEPVSPEQQAFNDLQVERMGTFKVGMGYVDAVYYRNMLDKATYKGPQQAYLLLVAKAEMSNVCSGLKDNDKTKRYEVDLTSACIESLGFFMNNFEGKGSDSAGKLFSASMLLRPSMGLINQLDEKLAEAKKTLDALNK